MVPQRFGAETKSDLHIQFLDQPGDVNGDPAGETLWYTTDILNEHGDPALKIWRGKSAGEYFIRYFNGLTFRIDAAISRVHVHCTQKIDQEEVCSFLLGPVMGIVLRMKGTLCLHASAVEIDGKAVAFGGPMGVGKSTTAAIFAKNGHAVLADDIVPLKKSGMSFLAHPGYPFLNLMPDSMALVFQSRERTQSADAEIEKVQLSLDGKPLRFQSQPLPTGAIYILEQSDYQSAAPVITPTRPQEAFIALASETYANKILDSEMRTGEFRVLGELANSVPVRRLRTCAGASKIQDIYEMLCKDAAMAMQSQLNIRQT